VIALFTALAALGCPAGEPPAYPAVRYEAEPFPPPDPRAFEGDAGPRTAFDAASD
jgi:hypothetical protein